jgi:DNA-directed RNA polymerase specialized sigma24 family protein
MTVIRDCVLTTGDAHPPKHLRARDRRNRVVSTPMRGTPCVAAHSTVRALYANYGGSLYQVRRASDGTDCSLDTWTRTIAARVVYKHIRRRKTERRIFGALDADLLAASRSASRPGREVMLREATRRVLAHLDMMDEGKSWAFVLHDVHGYDLREISEITDVRVTAEQTRLVRGRREIHERIAGDPELAQLLESTDGQS